MQFDRFFTERIPEAVRGLVYEAIATAPRLAVGKWFDCDDGCPTIRSGMAAVRERWTLETFPPRTSKYDNEHQERKIALALGVTEAEVREVWVHWDTQMTPEGRADFIARMKARYAAYVYQRHGMAPMAERGAAYAEEDAGWGE